MQPHPEANAVLAACPTTLYPIAQLGGGTGAFAVNGDIAYLAIGRRIEVIDVRSEAGVPTPDGDELPAIATLTLSGDVDHLAVSGATLVAGLESAREVWVYDVGDPRAPALRGRLALPGEVRGVVVRGESAFVGVPYHLLTVDLGAGGQVAVTQDTHLPHNDSFDSMTVHGDLLVNVGAGIQASTGRLVHGIRVVDVADPTAPRDLGAAEMMGGIYGLAIYGDVAYIAVDGSGVQTFDIADPLHPRRLGGVETPRIGLQVVVTDGRTAFGTAAVGLLYIYDVRDPAEPTLIKIQGLTGEGPEHLHFDGDRLVVASPGALHVLDVGDPAQPRLVGAHHTLGKASPAITARDGHVFVGTVEGMQSVDVGDPLAPRLRGHALLADAPEAIALDGDRAYAATGWFIWPGTVSAIDVRRPDAPIRLGSIATAGGLVSLAARSGQAWVTSVISDRLGGERWANVRLQAFDFGTPTQPRASGPFERPGALAFVDGVLYVFDGQALRVLDVGAAGAPRTIASVPFPERIASAIVVGQHVYAGRDDALFVFDVSDARAPALIDVRPSDVGATHLAADGKCLFGLHEGSGQDRRLDIVDVSSPARPSLVGHIGERDGLPRTIGIAAADGKVYLAAESDGLVVLGPDPPPTPTAAPPPRPSWVLRARIALPLAVRGSAPAVAAVADEAAARPAGAR